MNRSQLEPSEVKRLIVDPLKAANRENQKIIPVIGSGLSIPLGGPTWTQLAQALTEKFELEQCDREPQEFFGLLRGQSESKFTAAIQDVLAIPPFRTTSALQALATCNVKRIATTNLDYAVESAFQLSGAPIRPQNILLNGEKISTQSDSDVLLHKIHGTLNRPSSWVLTNSDYDRHYNPRDGELYHWWQNLKEKPLFIGSGTSDFDVHQSIRWAKYSNNLGGYIILPLESAQRYRQKLEAVGLFTIAMCRFDDIPEIIDDIFGCTPVKVTRTRSVYEATSTLRVGAASIEESANNKMEDIWIKALANGLELQTENPTTPASSGRQFGSRRNWKTILSKLDASTAFEDQAQAAQLTQAFSHYLDVFFFDLLPFLLRNHSQLKLLWPTIWDSSDEKMKLRIEKALQDELYRYIPQKYQIQKTIANILGKNLRSHPAQSTPPSCFSMNAHPSSAFIMEFPLTRYQAGRLLGDQSLIAEFPLRPYIIASLSDVTAIIKALEVDAAPWSWRLPFENEWISLATNDGLNKWPWGDEDPITKEHCHLNFGGGVEGPGKEPIEVGLFPRGRSRLGMWDLIGNVYELVLEDTSTSWSEISRGFGRTEASSKSLLGQPVKLAGGSFSTIFKPSKGWTHVRPIGTAGSKNIGLRLVKFIQNSKTHDHSRD